MACSGDKSLPSWSRHCLVLTVHRSSCSRLTAPHAVAGTAAAIIMERKLYLDLGGFDPVYKGHWESIDLAVRVRRAGHDLFLQPLSIVYHQQGSNFEANTDFAASLLRKDQLMAHDRTIFHQRCVLIAWVLPHPSVLWQP